MGVASRDVRGSSVATITVSDLVAEAAAALRAAGVEQPRLEARWLLGWVLDISESRQLAHPDQPISTTDADRYRDAVRRRANHEPFAYVVGAADFWGRELLVDRRVLVPREDTETLVAEALTLGPALRERSHQALVVDVGTGSGAIACALTSEMPWARVVASDISAEALAVAAQNRDRLGLYGRLQLVRGSLLSWLREPADLVVANLPYLPTARIPTLMAEVADWEPRVALDGGDDGLDLIRKLLADARRVMRPGGTMLLEMDPEQIAPTRALLPAATSRVIQDVAGLDRVLRLDLPA